MLREGLAAFASVILPPPIKQTNIPSQGSRILETHPFRVLAQLSCDAPLFLSCPTQLSFLLLQRPPSTPCPPRIPVLITRQSSHCCTPSPSGAPHAPGRPNVTMSDDKKSDDYRIDMPAGKEFREPSPLSRPPSTHRNGGASVTENPVAAILAYCGSSILMTVTNKYVLSGVDFNLPFFLLCVQV